MDELSRSTPANGIEYQVRLSRTAQGVRTYTVGASIPDGEFKQEAVTRLFELEQAVIREIEGPRSTAKRSGASLAAQMRRTIVLNVLRQSKAWLATSVILERAGGAVRSRSQLVADLSALVHAGHIEYQAGGNGRGKVSKYRLVAGQ